jgi:hypothetical protein
MIKYLSEKFSAEKEIHRIGTMMKTTPSTPSTMTKSDSSSSNSGGLKTGQEASQSAQEHADVDSWGQCYDFLPKQ